MAEKRYRAGPGEARGPADERAAAERIPTGEPFVFEETSETTHAERARLSG
ncbi:hypothetical protein ACFU76_03235 [Streptomyces sp. NPDC057539]|uniref:hypothetical protein n=1 Tax=Streptomyces sp. NPDC057539 TaxID=3346159 RepID=UPI0036B6D40F